MDQDYSIRSLKKGRLAGVPDIGDIVMVMEFDKAAPMLAEALLRGKVIPKLEIEVTATYGGARATYLKYELKNVRIVDYGSNLSGNDEAGPPTVIIGNNFEAIKVTYTEFDDEGGNRGSVEYEYKK